MKKTLNFYLLIILLAFFTLNISTATAQWEFAGPEGGSVNAFTECNGYLFASTKTVHGSVLRSADNGESWEMINCNFLNSNFVRSLTSLGDDYVFIGTGDGLYRSADNGDSWTKLENGQINPAAAQLVNACGTSIFVFQAGAGVYVSHDNGDTFQDAWVASGQEAMWLETMTAADTIMYVGNIDSYKGLFRSTDYGQSWTEINNGLEFFPGYICPIYEIAAYNSNVYIEGVSGITYEYEFFRSSDTGDNWEAVSDGLPALFNIEALTAKNGYVIAAILGHGLFKLDDNSTTWTPIVADSEDYRFFGLYVGLNDDVWVGTNVGVYKISSDFSTWTEKNNGFNAFSAAYRMMNLDTTIYVGDLNGGVYSSEDYGQSWTSLNDDDLLPSQTIRRLHPFGTDGIFIDGTNQHYISTDRGDTWTYIRPGNKDVRSVTQIGTKVFAANAAGVFRSLDDGASWTSINNGLPSNAVFTIKAIGSRLFVSNYSGGLYMSDDDGNTWVYSGLQGLLRFEYAMESIGSDIFISWELGEVTGLYKSSDNGLTWLYINDCIPIFENLYVVDTTLFAATFDYGSGVRNIWRTDDRGISWTIIDESLSDPFPGSIAFDGTNLYENSPFNKSMYYSPDNGASWLETSSGFEFDPKAYKMLIINDYIFAGTENQSVWRRSLDDYSAPVLPSAIIGLETPCIGSSQTYSVTYVDGVTYTWQFPSDWIITAGSDSNTVTVTVGSMSGLILVTPHNVFGSGPTQTLSVIPSIFGSNQPIFDSIGSLCQFSIAPILPDTSVNGITGIWNPDTISTNMPGTYEYIFTPDSGQCGSIDTMNIIIDESLTPEFEIIEPICQYYTPPVLPEISINGITGSWIPDIIITTYAGTFNFVFTPDSGQCATIVDIDIVIQPFPLVAGPITGFNTVCQGTYGVVYSVDPIGESSSYIWAVPSNAIITSGNETNVITVDYNDNALSGQVSVSGVNSCGIGAAAVLDIVVNPIPDIPVITQNVDILTSSAPQGNQWFLDGIAISGATAQTYQVVEDGYYSVMVTLNDCSSEMSDTIHIVIIGIDNHNTLESIDIYPNPNQGKFTISVSSQKREVLYLSIQNSLGLTIYKHGEPIIVDGKNSQVVDLPQTAKGFYVVILHDANQVVKRKIVIN